MPTHQSPAIGGRDVVVVMTQADKEALEDELRKLDDQERPLSREVARMNTDKDDAQSATIVARRSELATLARRRGEIIRTLSNAQVVEVSGAVDTVSIGSMVLVQIAGQVPTVQLQICRNGDANAGRITPESPIAKALLEGVNRSGRRSGAKEGETVVADTPSGPTEITVLSIINDSEGCNDT